MHGKVESRPDQIQFTGSEFRQIWVNCSTCAWQGLAGDLQSIPDSRLTGCVNYLCPDCAALLGIHAGLTNAEVLREFDRIKQELRDEFLDLCLDHQLQRIDPDCRPPDFRKVRERFYGA
jgi:hypothetical protein